MSPEEALGVADEALIAHKGQGLTDLQRLILQESLAGKGYEKMQGYEAQHFKNEGAKLFRDLTKALGERVSKTNFRGALERYQSKIQDKTFSQKWVKADRDVWLESQLQKSKERCIARWQSLGISRVEALQLFEDTIVTIPTSDLLPDSKRLKILVGDLGSGKSLTVEHMFQTAIRAAKNDSSSPIPIYFDSSTYQKYLSLEEGITDSAREIRNSQADRLLLFIDGIDEAGLSRSRKFIEEARVLTNIPSNISIILTSRPIPQLLDAEEAEEISLLSQEDAYDLVFRIAGKTIHGLSSRLQKDVKDAIKRPLFAILLGIELRGSSRIALSSKEQLLSNLVERCISPLEDNVLSLHGQLESLAVQSIDSGGMPVRTSYISTWSDRQKLLESRLVVQDGDSIKFPLPLITQWLAAQSLNSGKVNIEQLVEDPSRLEFWQYPIVIATATLEPRRVNAILEMLTRRHPLIAATIIQEAFSSQFRVIYQERKFPLPSAMETGQHIRLALTAWCAGLANLGNLIMPLDEKGDLSPMGVCVSEEPLDTQSSDSSSDFVETNKKAVWVKFVWGVGSHTRQEVVALPVGVEVESSDLKDASYISSNKFLLYKQFSWHWKFAHEETIRFLSNVLSRRGFPVTESSVEVSGFQPNWHQFPPLPARLPPTYVTFTRNIGRDSSIPSHANFLLKEGAWHAAYFLTRGYSNTVNLDPIPIIEIEHKLSQINYYRDALNRGADPLRLNQLAIELAYLHDTGESHLYYPWENNFKASSQELLDHVIDVYSKAIVEYQRLLLTWFPKFTDRLETLVRLPARFKGVLVFDSVRGVAQGLSWYWEIQPSGSSCEVDITLGERPISLSDPQFQDALEAVRSLRPEFFDRYRAVELVRGDRQAFGLTPVTDIVYAWLWNDLRKIGWAKDTLSGCGWFGITL
jgi:hypothetical protein